MPSHFTMQSIAARLDAGTYSAAIVARRPLPASSRPTGSAFAPLWTYAAAAACGLVIGLMLAS